MIRCPFCFAETDSADVCPSCGKNIKEYHETEGQLPLFTKLNNRFITGAVADRDKCRIEYYAFDELNGDCCRVQEFYPLTDISREANGVTVAIPADTEEKFNYSSRHFKERAAVIKKYPNLEAISKVRDVFNENQTVYYACEPVQGQTLREYVKKEMPAAEAFKLFKPVIRTLAVLHQEGIIHRGISPDSIIMTESGKLMITGFDSARDYLSRSELTVMLKQGFSAPEQYGKEGQGPWTDVYGMCATLYWLISWVTPADMMERMDDREALQELSSIAAGITEQQNTAIMTGLRMKTDERWKDMGELEKAIYQGLNSVTVPASSDNAKKAKKGSPLPVIAGIAAVIILIILLVVLL